MRIMPWLHFKDGVARVRRVVPVRLRPFFNGKTTISVDGKPMQVQVGLNLTVVGSKEAER